MDRATGRTLIVYNVSFTLRPAAMSVFYVYNQQYFFNTTIFPLSLFISAASLKQKKQHTNQMLIDMLCLSII